MKKLILTSIIVIGFGGALIMGILAWRNTNSGQGQSVPVTGEGANLPGLSGGGTPITSVSAILPEGTSLNFEKIKSFNKDERLFPFPQVTPTEIGANLGNIVE